MLFVLQAVGQETPVAVCARIQLLPSETISPSLARLDEYKRRALKDQTLADVAALKSFRAWKTFDDEFVSFRYPDHPRVKVEVKAPHDPIPVMGQPLGNTAKDFFRCYRLALGEHTYALLLLARTDAFDDGVCFCGHVDYQKYLFHNGSLCRFDLLETGDVKKVQVLRNGLRLVAFEWTHMPMKQEVYVDLALSVALKGPPCDEAAMRKSVLDKYGFGGRLGFLERGMSRAEVVALLGPATTVTESTLAYVETEGRWQTTTRIHLQDGVFKGLKNGWWKRVQLPAERGTVDWIVETVAEDRRAQSSKDDAKPKPLARETIQYIFDRFAQIGPTADAVDWDRLCGAIDELRKQGHTDERVLPIVRKRFEEKEVRQGYAAWLLHECDPNGSQELFARRIRLELDEMRKKAAAGDETETFWFGPGYDLHNLLMFLDRAHPKWTSFVLDGMDHPHAEIRRAAFFFWDDIPAASARPRLVRALADRDESVRQWVSKTFAESYGLRDDVPMLEKRLAAETDKETAANLQAAIARLRGLGTASPQRDGDKP